MSLHVQPRRVLVALAVILGLSACGRRSSPDVQPEPTADALVNVDNRGFSDMTIYVMRGAERIRLGVVNGNNTASFKIRNQYIISGPVRFLADPIGGDRSPVSEELAVNPGDVVTLTIPPN